jgi:stage V sporulation protein SpoVS
MHELHAVIASAAVIEELQRFWPEHRANALNQGLAILAMDEAFLHGLGTTDFRFPDLEGRTVAHELAKNLEPLLKALLRVPVRGPLGVVLTQYFGGAGTQAAVLIERGEIRLGPLVGDGSINQVLKALGVERDEGTTHDEFDALGLRQWRSTSAVPREAG